MMYSETEGRQELVRVGRSLFERGLTRGASANISVRLESGFLITPTNSCIGFLEADKLSLLDYRGEWVSGERPSKEFILHRAFYDQRSDAGAVIHLHSPYSTALSCLDVPDEHLFPPLTPYLLIRLGQVKRVPYFAPGDERLAAAVARVAGQTAGVLMANHGPIVAGTDLNSAMYAIEELEESARITLLLNNQPVNLIPESEVEALRIRYGHQPAHGV
ncbi:aldolase [Aestuariirhabdus sp. Z084]|uniref:3-oxo-tetronate 4-phosphate decarboxylase n=1 Tax=Aestuariirhabdus haliotis TaxID=2918751 RepID=UPI0020BEA67A|nr:3-oxo-tetronate 4-phosphate decarboxylase [Aestuariirhabdus haliotis]MCL6416106.1 aldolase [Aestuariirhabdus haliotis]